MLQIDVKRKGVALSVETIVLVVLALIVLASLAFVFTGNANPFGDTVRLTREKVTACSAYTQHEPGCTERSDLNDIRLRIANACGGLKQREGGYPGCTTGQAASQQCIWQCCGDQCNGMPRCREDLGGTSCGKSCPGGELTQGTPDCQKPPLDSTYKCCR
ncbi:MAG: hypothetical protein HYY37_02330 [Candidatus Aenigmarchaeota archaeon]|nr:hypothetical protein [Candidatus Aenigmarchaeota archaeon]